MSVDFYVDNGTGQIRAVYLQGNERVSAARTALELHMPAL